MRAAILTDIHSNLAALEAVLAATDEAGFERRWCLGDVVGYGAEPDECTRLVREHCEICLVGNHDLAVTGEIDTDVFSAAAAAAVEWTRENCDPATIEFLESLEPKGSAHDVGLFHASPRDPVWEYVLAVDQAAECMRQQPERVTLIGHSHIALYFSDGTAGDGGSGAGAARAEGGQAPDGHVIEVGAGRWLLNPGSVGQPRDGDARAAWLELDTDEWRATYHRVEYEIDRTAQAIETAGLPGLLAERLYVGQ
jgi:diadenosine tetraphosphatase ApaH/serine/threonine PP2A family protein phosphatase